MKGIIGAVLKAALNAAIIGLVVIDHRIIA
jgi:hypothetical protein